MAGYLTLSDLESAVGAAMVLRLLDDDGDGVADAAAVEAILVRAETFVAGHVSGKLPMAALIADADARAHLVSIAAPIAVEYAYQRRPEFTSREGTPYSGVYAQSVKTLQKIAENKYRIDIGGVPATPATSGGDITTPAGGTVSSGAICTSPPGAFTGGFFGY